MKPRYSTRLGPHRKAVLDLCKSEHVDGAYHIDRVNVPREFRSQGHGTTLLERVTEDADFEGIPLTLVIIPYGDLSYDQLQSWYESFGFEEFSVDDDRMVFVREPG